jgi:hypothetical protein
MNTPEQINTLLPNEVFVYGSNQFAAHQGGAARFASENFGAINGLSPNGLVNQSYGIITTSFNEKPITLQFIKNQIQVLYGFAELRPDLKFYVTKIGTNIAGFSINEIAQLFFDLQKSKPFNIILPKEFQQ